MPKRSPADAGHGTDLRGIGRLSIDAIRGVIAEHLLALFRQH